MKHRSGVAIATLTMAAQAALAFRVYRRLQRTSGPMAVIERERFTPPGRITIIVPALNDLRQLGPCLRGLHGQGPAVTDILVVDRGSTDGTQDLVRAWEIRDRRIQLVSVSTLSEEAIASMPEALATGVETSPPGAGWILVVDPAMRPRTGLGRSLLGHALNVGADLLSVSVSPPVSGALDAIIRPALAAAAEIRFGGPGVVTSDPDQVRACPGCLLIRRNALAEAGGFASLPAYAGWEFELARRIAVRGRPVACAETNDLITADPLRTATQIRERWANAPVLRAASGSNAGLTGLAEIALVQAAPLPLALLLARKNGALGALGKINLGLLAARIAFLGASSPETDSTDRIRWLAPLADIPVGIAVAVRSLPLNRQ